MGGQYRWLFAFLALVIPLPALADSPASPWSYKEVTPGGKFVLVMLAPGSVEDDVGPFNEETAADIREIRHKYARSGMYRNNGSVEPLWTVDWYAHGVEVMPDGVHLIRHGPWASLPENRYAPLGAALDEGVELLCERAIGQNLQDQRVGR